LLQVVPFPLFDRQVRFVLATLDGTVHLPSTEQMLEEIRQEKTASQAAGVSPDHFHVFGKAQWAYNARLTSMAGFEPLAPVIENLYEAISPERLNNLIGYRSQSFKIVDRRTFERL